MIEVQPISEYNLTGETPESGTGKSCITVVFLNAREIAIDSHRTTDEYTAENLLLWGSKVRESWSGNFKLVAQLF